METPRQLAEQYLADRWHDQRELFPKMPRTDQDRARYVRVNLPAVLRNTARKLGMDDFAPWIVAELNLSSPLGPANGKPGRLPFDRQTGARPQRGSDELW